MRENNGYKDQFTPWKKDCTVILDTLDPVTYQVMGMELLRLRYANNEPQYDSTVDFLLDCMETNATIQVLMDICNKKLAGEM